LRENTCLDVQQLAEIQTTILDANEPKDDGKAVEQQQKAEPEEEENEDFLVELENGREGLGELNISIFCHSDHVQWKHAFHGEVDRLRVFVDL